ncbi:Ig-like domain-containing protein, partial [candidate division KSB1 bacterium]|nr:Ig-like domain-containing protein [candidate division KSB1 bacterium]
MFLFKNKLPLFFIIFLFFIADVSAGTPPNHDNLIYSSSLKVGIDPAVGQMVNREGQFISGEGWKATTQNSQLKITLPDTLPYEGTFSITVTNFNPATQNVADKQNIINLFSRPEGAISGTNPVGSWTNIRTGIGYSDGPGQAGFKFLACADGATQVRSDTRVRQWATWDLSKSYEFKIVWNKSNIYVLVNGETWGEWDFTGQIERFRYIFLGTDNQGPAYVAQPGPIYYDLKIYTSDAIIAHRQLTFTDITTSAGVKGIKSVLDGITLERYGHGVSFNDVNQDGKIDIFYANAGKLDGPMPDVLYVNQGYNQFQDQSSSRNIEDNGHTHAVVSADFDNDGDLDVFMSNQPVFESNRSVGRNRIYRNDGNGNFTDITDWTGITTDGLYSRGAIALDVNNDGNIDLFNVNWGVTSDVNNALNELYINDGTGKMTRVHQGTDGPSNDPVTYGRQGVTAADFDNDGDLDIYVCRRDAPNWLFVNDGTGHFTEQASTRGVSAGATTRSHGATFVDIDNDGDLDLFVMNYKLGGGDSELPPLNVFINRGDGTFTDKTSIYNIFVSGYTTVFGDVDNDADLDMYLIRNDEREEGTTPKLYLNDGHGNLTYFYEPNIEVPANGARGTAYGDIDNDGDIDFYIACTWGPNFLIRNNLNNSNHYIRVLCIGPKGDYGGFGAKVSIYEPGHMDDPNYLLGYQESVSSFSYMSQNQTALHFGLGSNNTCDVKVEYLTTQNGQKQVVRQSNVTADQVLQVSLVVPVPSTLERVSNAAVNGTAGQIVSEPVRVRVMNDKNSPVANHPVSFTITNGNGFLNGSTRTQVDTVTNSNGIASVTWKLGTQTSVINTLNAAASYKGLPLTNSPLGFSATVAPGPDSLLQKHSGDNQYAAPNAPLPDSVKVFVHDVYDNPQRNVPILFQVITGGGSIGGSASKTVKTNSLGIAAVLWTLGSSQGENSHSLKASMVSDPQKSVTFQASTSMAPIKELKYISGRNQTGTVGTTLNNPFVVQLLDSLGIPRGGFQIKFKVMSGGGNFGGETEKTVQTDPDGKAAVMLTLGQTAGTDNNIIKATCDGITDEVDFTASANAGAPKYMQKENGDKQNGSIAQVLPLPLTVKITDLYGNPVSGQPVTFTVVDDKGYVNDKKSDTVNSNALGLAQVTHKLGPTPGSYSVNVTSTFNNNHLTGSPAVFTATATSEPAKLEYVSGDSTIGVINQQVPLPLQVRITDKNGYPVSNYNVTFVSESGGGNFNGNLQIQQTTNEQGVASVYPALGDRVGYYIYVFKATAFGEAGEPLSGSPYRFYISAKKSDAEKIELVAGDDQSGQAGEFLTSSLQVKVKNIENNIVPNHDVTFTVIKGSGKLGNSQSDKLTIKTASNGIAKVDFKLGTEIGDSTHKVQVTSNNGLYNLVNSPITIVADAPYGQPDSIKSSINISNPVIPADGQTQLVITIHLKDEKNNPVPGEELLVNITGSNNTVQQPGAATDGNGSATASVTSTKAERKKITVNVKNKNITLKSIVNVDFVAGTAQNIEEKFGNNQTGTLNSVLPNPLVVKVTDAFGNAVKDHRVTFSVKTGKGTVQDNQPVLTDTAGLAKCNWILGPTIGEQTLEATAENVTGSVLFRALAGMPAIATIQKIKGDEQFASPGTLFPDSIIVRIKDSSEHPISAIPVYFSIEQGDASFTSPPVVNSDSYGYARAKLAAGQHIGIVIIRVRLNDTLFIDFTCSVSASLPDTIIHILGDGSESTVGSEIYPLTVKVLDKESNPISGVPVTFTGLTDGGIITDEQPIRTNSTGQASAHAKLDTVSGMYLFSATNTSLKGSPVIFHVKALPDNASDIIFAGGNNQTGDPLKILEKPLQIKIIDRYGNGIPDIAVTFQVTNGGGQIIQDQPVITDSLGVASSRWSLGSSGEQRVTVTSPVLPQKALVFTANLKENLLPVITVVSDTSIYENNTLIFKVAAIDPEGGEVALAALNLPDDAEFDAVETRQFSWTPGYNDQGDYFIEFTATDESGGKASKTVTIHVLNVNRKPGILSTIPEQTNVQAHFNKVQAFEVKATDADNDTLHYCWYVDEKLIKSQNDSAYLMIMPNESWPEQFNVDVVITDKIDTVGHSWTVKIIQTKVELTLFEAQADKDLINIVWQTRNENNTTGYNILRATAFNGPYSKINQSLIPATREEEYKYTDNPAGGSRIYYYKLEELAANGECYTFAPVQVKIALPESNRLLQNYPNPFNPETTIKYELKNPQFVEIRIFNISGQLIKTIFSGQLDAGYHLTTWNGQNDNDIHVTSGIYYCLMTGENW